jgi:hypothetical protein
MGVFLHLCDTSSKLYDALVCICKMNEKLIYACALVCVLFREDLLAGVAHIYIFTLVHKIYRSHAVIINNRFH